MRPQTTRRRREGFSLIEMIIAMIIMVVIFSIAMPFFTVQAKTVGEFGGRMDAMQNARFAFNTMDRELRMAGVGVLDLQPTLIQADTMAVTFNSDLVSTDSGDASAIYYNPDMLSTETLSLPRTSPITLPRGVQNYPDSNYQSGTFTSRAETISFWVSQDSTSGRPDQYVLWRRVNNTLPRVVAKNIIVRPGQRLFRYFRDSTGTLVEVPPTMLPMYHGPIHGGASDTGSIAWIDSIRVVRMTVTGLYKDPRTGDQIRKVEGSIRLLNAGLQNGMTCGDAPLPIPVAYLVNSDTSVTLSWSASVDQQAGEKDVERYALFKRFVGEPWGEPYVSVSAGPLTYQFVDYDLIWGQTYQFGLVAQDCGPTNSSLTTTPNIVFTP